MYKFLFEVYLRFCRVLSFLLFVRDIDTNDIVVVFVFMGSFKG